MKRKFLSVSALAQYQMSLLTVSTSERGFYHLQQLFYYMNKILC